VTETQILMAVATFWILSVLAIRWFIKGAENDDDDL
jgi:hypothetical protein